MTQRNQYTPYPDIDCNCYKCRVKREVGQFQEYLSTLADKFGGKLPRNYFVATRFNNRFPMNGTEVTLETVTSVKSTVSEIIARNEKLKEEFKARKVRAHRIVHCADCGTLTLKADKRTLDSGEHVCENCAASFYKYCSHCSTLKVNNGFYRSPLGIVCNDCFKKHFFKCQRCESVHPLGKKIIIDLVSSSGTRKYEVCGSCYNEHHHCVTCGKSIFCSNSHYENHLRMCDACYADRGAIKAYSYKPSPKFCANKKVEKGAALNFGVETEWERVSGSRNLEDVCVAITKEIGDGVVYFKRDGSINDGFEMVTHPFSFDWLKENRDKVRNMLDKATKLGMGPEHNCGVHVHISKNAFTTFHLFKFVKFLLSSSNRDFMNLIAGRRSNNYCTYQDPDTTPKGFIQAAKRKVNPSGNRHAAVNMTGRTTMEIRIFASTIDYVKWMANVEFLHALYVYSKDHTAKDMTHGKFKGWLSAPENEYNYANIRTHLSISNPRIGKKK